MNTYRKRHPGTLLIILALGALLGACGAEQPTGATVNTKSVVVTVGTPTAGLNTCMSCHPVTVADWLTTRHANVESIPSVTTNAACTICHDKLGDSQFVTSANSSTPRMVVSCEACHGGGSLHVAAGGAGPIGFAYFTAGVISGSANTTPVSAQFATCTGCHQLLSLTTTASAATTTAVHDAGGSDPRVVTQGSNSNINSITDSHFAKSPYTGSGSLPSGYPAGSLAVSGYAMDYASERVCVDCHNPHGTAEINREWAQSAHANRYGASTKYFAAAWARINWTYSSSNVVCQRCHTTTGLVSLIDALQRGDETTADNIRHGLLVSLPKTTQWKPEMLKCAGCHTDNKGTIRNPGAVTADYDYVSSGKTYAKASHAYPDISSSNVCLLCHTARESGDTLKALNDPSLLSAGTITFFDFSNNSLITSHYLTGGGTVFKSTGYEFANRNYSNPSSFIHDKIGTSAVPNSGTSGPCAGCHMSRPNKSGNHIFMPVTRLTLTLNAAVSRASATITGIASQVCWNCHDKNEALLLEQIREQKIQYEESLAALLNQLEKRDYFFDAGFKKVVTKGTATLVDAITVELVSTATISARTDKFRFLDDDTFLAFTITSGTTITIPAYTGSVATGTSAPSVIINADRTAGAIKQWLTQAAPAPFAVPDTATDGSVSGKNNTGAAFNFYLLESEPAGYVHNRYYVKRLIYDSIDWIDDNEMNYSTGVSLDSACTGGYSPACEAMVYVLVGGQKNDYSSAERP